MAETEVGRASVEVGDSAGHLASASFRVTPAKARLYFAAADAAARLATDVGKLLNRALLITQANATTGWKRRQVQIEWVSDAFVYADESAGIYNSNRWKVTGSTTNNGVPAIDTVYVPEYLISGVVMESDGISADLSDPPVSDFVTEFVNTALSKYGTAFSVVLSIQRSDS